MTIEQLYERKKDRHRFNECERMKQRKKERKEERKKGRKNE